MSIAFAKFHPLVYVEVKSPLNLNLSTSSRSEWYWYSFDNGYSSRMIFIAITRGVNQDFHNFVTSLHIMSLKHLIYYIVISLIITSLCHHYVARNILIRKNVSFMLCELKFTSNLNSKKWSLRYIFLSLNMFLMWIIFWILLC